METISGRVNMLSMSPGWANAVSIHFQGKEGDDPKYPKGGQIDMLTGEVTCDGKRVTIGEFFEWFLSRVGAVDAVIHDSRNDYLAAQKAEFTSS